jgi:DNA-binding beta-propeller fold protein YncE
VALVDTRTLTVRVKASPGRVRHLVLAKPGGPVLLPAELRNELSQLALPSGRVISSTPLPDHPHNAAVIGPNIWVADEFAPAVSVIDPSGTVIQTLHGPLQPGGVAAADGTVGVVDVRGARMYFYDATTFAGEGSIALGAGPTHAAPVGGRYVAVADTRGGALLLVDLAARRVVSRLPLAGGPYGVASDPSTGQVWVTLTARNQLVEVARHGQQLAIDDTWPTVRQPNTVAVDPTAGCEYVAGVTPAALEVICKP